MTVLVVYASRHGATAGIAARIAARLADSGAAVDLRQVDDVQTPDGYDAVVFGGRFGDHRDWPVIDAWAEKIAMTLPGLRSGLPA